MSTRSRIRKVLVGKHIQTMPRRHKIKRSEYLVVGRIPVIDQGQEFIAGYINDEEQVYDGPLPVIVFGDHTCTLKYVDFPFAVGADGTQLIRPMTDFDVRYFYYSLRSLNLEHFGYQRHFKYLQGKKVLWRPMEDQHKIAAILSAYDDLIENNTRRIAILEEMAQAHYREWFVHFRFPGHEQVAMVDSELGPIPEGWEVVKLASIADVNAASIRGDESPEQINYVNISSVSTGRIENIEPMAFEDAPSRARRIVEHGDIIWSTVRPNRKSYCLILDPVPNMIVSTGFAVITARQVPYTYLYHALTTDKFVAYLTNNATGAAYPAVNTGDFENADVLLPAGEPVQTFHNIVVDLFDEKQNLHKRNEVLRRTRDLLLPRLISGEIDVSELEINTGGLDQ